MRYTVHITTRALLEIEASLEWLSQRSARAALRWYERLMEAIQSLETNPLRYPLAVEDELYEGELREFLHGKRRGVYRVLFEVRGNRVFIVRVRHSARDFLRPEDI
jgi:plasmid stabilization system protein ParE